ncbi:MAG: PIN domain-containing protein [Deltaproteobacteria bacterium]|nr:PIN domain-containing protein [Deltaproteobacteria bacterium]
MSEDVLVLVDTSAWLEFFKRGEGQVANAVYRLVREDRAVLVGPVLAELLQSARTEKEKETLRQNLSTLRYVEADRRDWTVAGSMLAKLRRKGVHAPLTDALIAVLSVRHNLAILTLDKHFAHFSDMQWYAVT